MCITTCNCGFRTLCTCIVFRALLEAQEIFGLDFDPSEFDQVAREGLGSEDEEEEEVSHTHMYMYIMYMYMLGWGRSLPGREKRVH